MRRFFSILSAILFAATFLSAQNTPHFAGTWKLNLAKSKLQTANPPSASTAVITYDGVHWTYKRTHEYSARKPESFSFDLQVNALQAHIDKEGPFTFATKLARAGNTLVLTQNITASNGQQAASTSVYSLTNNAQTLTEIEHKQTPSHQETNRWVFDRVVK